jgi:diguanylate cyclase (GGDEF)-like protein
MTADGAPATNAMKAISIKWKVAIAAAVFSVLSVILAGAIQLHFLRDDLRRVLSDEQFSLVTRTAGELDAKFDANVEALSLSAVNLSLAELNSPEAFRHYFEVRPAMVSLFGDLALLSPEGITLADVPQLPGRVGLSAADREFFKRVVATKKPVISDPLLSRTRHEPIVSIAVPVLDAKGGLAAVLVGVLRLEKSNFLAGLGTARIGKTGYFALITRSANPVYVMHPDRSLLLQSLRPGNTAALSGALDGFEGSMESANSSGLRALSSFKSLKRTNWILIAVLPVEEAFAPIAQAEQRTYLVLSLMALFIVPLAWAGTWKLLGPLSRLRGEIQRLRGSESGFVPVRVEHMDEIGKLAQDFNALMTERAQLTEQLQELAHRDQLTGIPNRTLFYDRLAQALARSRRGHNMCVLFYLDLDGFKGINDTLGHAAGDEILKQFSARLLDLVRGVDTVARLGGDEFVIILEQLHRSEDAYRIAQNIIDAMQQKFDVDGETVNISTSIGIAFDNGVESADDIIARADAALYQAKHAGRNMYRVSPPLGVAAAPPAAGSTGLPAPKTSASDK